MKYRDVPHLVLSTEYEDLTAAHQELIRQHKILQVKREILLAEYQALSAAHKQLKAAGGDLSTYCTELEMQNEVLRDKLEAVIENSKRIQRKKIQASIRKFVDDLLSESST